MNEIINIAGYKFITLHNLPELRVYFKKHCQELALKGTILLSTEGVNIMLAGEKNNIEKLELQLKQDDRFSDLTFKYSISDFVPFKRLMVKIKKEIITFAMPNIAPEKAVGPTISPNQFKQWLAENRDITVLDTRNICEIEMGTFKNAVDLGINNFRDLPQAIQKLPEQAKEKPMVMFCTGGVRCEKASLYMLQQGYKEVYQLDGGILKYFEQCGDAYYQGKCFVFDERVAITPAEVLG